MQVIQFSESLQKELDDAKTSNKYVDSLVKARVNELTSNNYMLTVERMRELTALENYLAN